MSKNIDPKYDNPKTAGESEKAFAKCCLGREKYAKLLTHIISNYQQGFVLALNNPWGTGKTTFLNMWQKYLEQNKYQVLHFNAWKSDYSSDPFIALISQLKQLGDKKASKAYKGFMTKAATLVKRLGPAVVKSAVKRVIDDDELEELAGISADITAESLEKQIKEQLETEKSIEDFTCALGKLVSESDGQKPLVFIIDELDRCRPNYAVSVLEYIKHFFNVEGIVFVLAVDKEQLGHAIRGVYGSEKIDADEYLRRFIDLEYIIPEPHLDDFCELQYIGNDFDGFFKNKERLHSENLKNEGEHFKRISKNLLSQADVSPRLIKKIFFQARVILSTLLKTKRVNSALYFFLIYLKHLHNEAYNKIRNNEYSLGELAKFYEQLIDFKYIESDRFMLLYTEACLMTFYANYCNLSSNQREKLDCLSVDNRGVTFETTHKGNMHDNFVTQLVNIYRGFDRDYSIHNFFEMIEMSDNFEIPKDD